MNMILINESETENNIACLKDGRFSHIRNILKSKTGDSVKCGIKNGLTGYATVDDITENYVRLKLFCDTPPPENPEVTIILALPRPKVFRRILFGMVCAGVKNIHVINSWRVEKSYWESPYLIPERIDEYCMEALSQAKDTIMPQVTFHRFFMNFINETLPMLPLENRYIAHPYDSEKSALSSPCVVAVGCEGGFIDKEIKTFIRCGFAPFSIGQRILTTEHAVPYILGMIK